MAKEVFRKKSLDKVNSPEELNSYLRVTTPSLIIALIAAIILIIGAVFWGTFAKIETRVKAVVSANTCYIHDTDAESVEVNKSTVKLNNKYYKIKEVGERISYPKLPDEIKSQGVFVETEYTIKLTIEEKIDHAYPCEVVLKSVSPMEFLFKNY